MCAPELGALKQRNPWADTRNAAVTCNAREKGKTKGSGALAANRTRAPNRKVRRSVCQFLEHFAPDKQRRRHPPARPTRTGLDLPPKELGPLRRLWLQEWPSQYWTDPTEPRSRRANLKTRPKRRSLVWHRNRQKNGRTRLLRCAQCLMRQSCAVASRVPLFRGGSAVAPPTADACIGDALVAAVRGPQRQAQRKRPMMSGGPSVARPL